MIKISIRYFFFTQLLQLYSIVYIENWLFMCAAVSNSEYDTILNCITKYIFDLSPHGWDFGQLFFIHINDLWFVVFREHNLFTSFFDEYLSVYHCIQTFVHKSINDIFFLFCFCGLRIGGIAMERVFGKLFSSALAHLVSCRGSQIFHFDCFTYSFQLGAIPNRI